MLSRALRRFQIPKLFDLVNIQLVLAVTVCLYVFPTYVHFPFHFILFLCTGYHKNINTWSTKNKNIAEFANSEYPDEVAYNKPTYLWTGIIIYF